MKKFYNEPSMTVEMFNMENVVTASGEKIENYTSDTNLTSYAVKTIDVAGALDFIF